MARKPTMKSKRSTASPGRKWFWECAWQDERYGPFHPDYEGRCASYGRKGFKSKEDAVNAAVEHSRRHGGILRARVYQAKFAKADLRYYTSYISKGSTFFDFK